LAENMELLRQQVNSRREKLAEATSVVGLNQQRLESATAVQDEVDHEHRRLKSSLGVAERRARRLAKQTKRAKRLAREARDDRRDAENELAEHLKRRDKQQSKLTKAEAALSAAETVRAAEERTTAPRPAAQGKRSASAGKRSVRKTPATKSGTAARSTRKAATKRAPAKRSTRRQS
jgi:DNA repair exonuclease SbcCD ATPase subunit